MFRPGSGNFWRTDSLLTHTTAYEFISLQTLCKDAFCELSEVIWKQDQGAIGSLNWKVYYLSSLPGHDTKMLLHSVWKRWRCSLSERLTCLWGNSYFIVCLLSWWLWVLASCTIWVNLKFCEIGINTARNFGWIKKFTLLWLLCEYVVVQERISLRYRRPMLKSSELILSKGWHLGFYTWRRRPWGQ